MGKYTLLQEDYIAAKSQYDDSQVDYHAALKKWREAVRKSHTSMDIVLANSELNISACLFSFWRDRLIIAQNELLLREKEVEND